MLADSLPAPLRAYVPHTRDDARRFGAFFLAVEFLNVLFNLRFPSAELHFWYLLPSFDVAMLLIAFVLVRGQGLRVPTFVHGLLTAYVVLVRVLRFGDGIQDRYFAQRFSLYDLAMLPEGVRFAHSVLPWWKFYLALAVVGALLVLLPVLVFRALRTAEEYFDDVKRAPFVGLLAIVAFGIGLCQPRKAHHKPLFFGGFGISTFPRLRREATFLVSVVVDRGKWSRAIAAAGETLAKTPQNLSKLGGKNVHFILVESYGVVAVDRPEFVHALTPTFQALETELGALGYSIASGRLDSPTFGGRSWLAHATLATAVPTTDQLGFDTIAAVKPRVLSSFFRAAGYRTVLAAPGVTRPGTRGDLYRFDKNYYFHDYGYVGPGFAWATMPDQFVFDTIRRRELARQTSPLFIQYVLVSSHAPWSETPTIVEDWSRLGNGAIFDRQPVVRFPIVWPNFQHAHEAYIRSVVYDFELIKRYVEKYLNDDSLVIVLGDHQPVVEISGDENQHGVPVHVFSKNRAFVEPFMARGYVSGMWPRGKARARGMETFLPDLLRDFSTKPGEPHASFEE